MTDTSEYTLGLLAAELAKFKLLVERHREDPILSKLFTDRLNWIERALKVKQGGGPLEERDTNLYHRCWDVLAAYAGAYEGDKGRERARFVQAACEQSWAHRLTEYRFGGSMGFGGKFWRFNGKLYVTCYAEDLDADREATMKLVNTILNELRPVCGVYGPP